MSEYKYNYLIYANADEEIFIKQCRALERHIPNITKDCLLEDVDGTQIQIYWVNGNKIAVYNDYFSDEVHVRSEIELTQFFK